MANQTHESSTTLKEEPTDAMLRAAGIDPTQVSWRGVAQHRRILLEEYAKKTEKKTGNSPKEQLTTAMLRGIGANTVQVAWRGAAQHERVLFQELTEAYTRDPKEVVAHAREELFAVGQDANLSPDEKEAKLGTYLDAYFGLTIELDRKAFPETAPGKVEYGVPDYLPDGFVDMGGESNLQAQRRSREQISVDKQAILDQHKEFLTNLFSRSYEGMSLQKRKENMTKRTAAHIYSVMQYNYDIANGKQDLGGGIVNLSEMSEGVCRHQALVFQVLCQTIGIKSRVLKAYMDGGKHSTNMVRLDDQWNIFDVTNPDYTTEDDGKIHWRSGIYPVDRPPQPGETKKYDVTGRFSGDKHVYEAHDDMYWRVER